MLRSGAAMIGRARHIKNLGVCNWCGEVSSGGVRSDEVRRVEACPGLGESKRSGAEWIDLVR